MDIRPSSWNVCNSLASEIPLWFVSCHKRSEPNTESLVVICPSLSPPFSVLSYSARARKPFFSSPAGGSGCGVKLPNTSAPLSMTPLPFRSSVSQASSLPAAVQDRCSAVPSTLRSKFTPPALSVNEKPSPFTSISTGLPPIHLQTPGAYTTRQAKHSYRDHNAA